MKLRTFLTALTTSCLLIALSTQSGCSSIKLPKGSSSGYTSYRLFKHVPADNPNYISEDDAAFLKIESEINTVLQANGLQVKEEGAELMVSFLVLVQSNAVSTSLDDYYATSSSEILAKAHKIVTINKDFPTDFEAGTLVIDIFDINKEALIYRDYASKQLIPGLTQAENEKRIADAVQEALAKFVR